MSTIATVSTVDSLLTADSTLTVDGVTYPIPIRATLPSGHQTALAPHRVMQAVTDAGYRKVGQFEAVDASRTEFEVEFVDPRPGTAHPRDRGVITMSTKPNRPPVIATIQVEARPHTETVEYDRDEWEAATPEERRQWLDDATVDAISNAGGAGWRIDDPDDRRMAEEDEPR